MWLDERPSRRMIYQTSINILVLWVTARINKFKWKPTDWLTLILKNSVDTTTRSSMRSLRIITTTCCRNTIYPSEVGFFASVGVNGSHVTFYTWYGGPTTS